MESTNEEDFSKLSLSEKLSHKVWKARSYGYEALKKLFEEAFETDKIFTEYDGKTWKNYLSDTNVAAQEKALEAFLVWQDKSSEAAKTAPLLCPILVQKGLSSARTGTKQKAIDALMMYIELETPTPVIEELITGVKHKNPKVGATALTTIHAILHTFGPKSLPFKQIIKMITSGVFDHSDKNIRAGAFNITVELYRWMGAGITSQISELREVQQKELEAAFKELPKEAPQPLRRLRSEAEKGENINNNNNCNNNNNLNTNNSSKEEQNEPESFDLDPYELADPVDVISKISTEAIEKLDEKKWSVKTEGLDEILKVCGVIKIAPNPQLTPLIKTLKGLISDINVQVNVKSIQAIGLLAKGMRASFPFQIVLVPLLQKFKEKKQNTIDAIHLALTTMYENGCFTLPDILVELTENLKNKIPQTRENTALWLCTALSITQKASMRTPIIKAIKPVTELILATMDDTVEAVRNAAAKSLAWVALMVPPKTAKVFLDKLDKIKMTKVEELMNEINPNASQSGNAAPAAQASNPTSAQAKPTSQSTNPLAPPSYKPLGVKSTLPTHKKKPSTSSKPAQPKEKKKQPNASAKPTKLEPIEEPIPSIIDPDQALEQIEEVLPSTLLSKFSSAKWQERKEAMEELNQWVLKQGDDLTKQNANIIFRQLEKKPGFKDIPQVTSVMFTTIGTIAATCKQFCKGATVLIIPYLIDKIGDAKLKAPVLSTLTSLAEAHSIGFLIKEVSPLISKSKNPKSTQEGLLWIQSSIEDFHLPPSITMKDLIETVKSSLDVTNPTVRTAATKLACTLRKFVGPSLLDFFSDLKGPKLTSLEKEFSKVSALPADAEPTKYSRDEPKAVVDKAASSSSANLLPREDLGAKLSPTVIQQLADGPLKEKKAALEEIEQAINACHKRIGASLPPEMLNVLKNRLTDNTALLVVSTLDLLSLLATSMGNLCSKHVKTIIPSVLSCLTRNQKNIKDAANGTMDAWKKQIGLEPLVEHIKTALTQSTTTRKDILLWLSKHAGTPACKELIKLIIPCLDDKNAECRKFAELTLKSVGSVMSTAEVSKFAADPKVAALLGPGGKDSLPEKETGLAHKKPEKIVVDNQDHQTNLSKPPSKLPKPTGTTQKKPVMRTAKAPATANVAKPKSPAKEAKSPSPVKKSLPTEQALMQRGTMKEARLKKSLKQRPWVFENDKPDPEQIEGLKKDFSLICTGNLTSKLFAKDFNKQVEAINELLLFLDQPEGAAVHDNADLVFKWITLRLIETNTTLVKRALELLSKILEQMDQRNEILSDPEAVILLPFLVEKVGSPNDSIKQIVRELFQSLSKAYPDSKLFKFILEGIHSKNSKTRCECIEELGLIFERQGLSVCVKSKVLPLIAERWMDRDMHVRNAVISCLAVIYNQIGADLFQYLPEKERQSLMEKLEKPQAPTTPRAPTSTSKIAHKKTPSHSENSGLSRNHMTTPIKSRPRGAESHQEDSDTESHQEEQAECSPLLQKVKQGDVETLKMLCLSEDDTIFMIDSNELVETLTALLKNSLDASEGVVPWRLYKYILNTLHRMFREANIAKCISYKPLQGLIKELTLAVVNPLLQGEDEKVIVKATNQLLAKVLDNTDRTDSFTILLQYLTDLVPKNITQTTYQQRLIGLVIKCLLTLARTLKVVIDKLQLPLILRDIHKFLEAHPPDVFKKHSEKETLPLVAIKTILSEIVLSKREEVHDHLDLIPTNKKETPAILLYITTMLKQNQPQSSSSGGSAHETRISLTNIFKKIAQNKDQGLLELYHFKKQNPSVNVESYISGSERFQTIIRKGLAEIERKQKTEPSPAPTTQQANPPKPSTVAAPLKDRTNSQATHLASPVSAPVAAPSSLSTLRERLNQIEHAGSVPKKQDPRDESYSSSAKENHVPAIDSTSFVSTSASDLKERLARLKAKMPSPIDND